MPFELIKKRQRGLDECLEYLNNEHNHKCLSCGGRTPMEEETLRDGKIIWHEKFVNRFCDLTGTFSPKRYLSDQDWITTN